MTENMPERQACAHPEPTTKPSETLPHWTKHWRVDEITCPWCGSEWSDSWEVSSCHDGAYDSVECEECERPFEWRCDVTVAYTTRRLTSEVEGDSAGGGR